MDATSTVNTLINGLSDQISQISNKVSGKVPKSNFFDFLNFKINWSQPTWDLIIFLFFIILVIFYTFSIGKEKITATIFSTYLSLAIVNSTPSLDKLTLILKQTGLFAFQTTAFLVIFVILFFLLMRSNVLEQMENFYVSIWQIFLFSFLQVGLFISIILSFLPDQALNYLSVFTKIIFISDFGQFLWIILPIVALIFIPAARRPQF